jgi:hypothetical protein
MGHILASAVNSERQCEQMMCSQRLSGASAATAVDRVRVQVIIFRVHMDKELEHVVAQADDPAGGGYAETVQADVMEQVLEGCAANEDRPKGPVDIGAVMDAKVLPAAGEAVDVFRA